MSALNVVADHPDVACCVVVSYPVTDLAHLAATSHRFERHSVRTLVGGEENYRSRSPLFKAVALKHTPMLVMHGDADPVVPIVQGASLVEAVRSAGGRVEFEVMQGEGHGFRAPENKMREFHAMETFLDSVMGR
jgi:dipeptidyl aminopeptidase/acylaminoacyl peptidase